MLKGQVHTIGPSSLSDASRGEMMILGNRLRLETTRAPLPILLLAVAALLCSRPAVAGNISFDLSLTGSQLTVINRGSPAFYPAVFRMLPDGMWAQVDASSAPAELPNGAPWRLTWPDSEPSELERIGPVMVRFFDQSGVGFGQITFFSAPPQATTVLTAGYVNRALQVEPPPVASPIRATWILWAQEDGIRPIHVPVRFSHHQPPARRIDWRSAGTAPVRLDTGAGQPAVILLHETDGGHAQQFLPDGGLQGREQRAAWLDATPRFYAASLVALALAAGAKVLELRRRSRRLPVPGDTAP
jgi:hypothetical protein